MDNAITFFGLMKKASALAIGAEGAYELTMRKKARLIVIASDASVHSSGSVKRAGEEMNVPVITLPYTKAQLGAALGQKECAAAALKDTGFAASLCVKLGLAELSRTLQEKADRERARRSATKGK